MGKQSLYDHSLHVPLIMSGPGVPQGGKSDAFCYLLDIYPTLCDLVGVPIPATVEGRSLVGAMQDAGEQVRETLLFAYTGVQRAVQDRQYKLIETVVEGRRTTQLFDLQADPWEIRDLSSDPHHTERLRSMRQELRRWRSELGDTQPGQGEPFWQGFEGV
jgi:arylsulfatase A-like enzyme